MKIEPNPKYTDKLVDCFHCSNSTYMEIIAQVTKHEDIIEPDEYSIDFDRTWSIYLCPNCNQVNFHLETYYSEWDEEHTDNYGNQYRIPGIQNEILYPYSRKFVVTPKNIVKLFNDAKHLTPIDPESALVKIRRLLEAICTDQNATGDNLFSQLSHLARQGIIPQRLARVADLLRLIGNMGAHGDSSLRANITQDDVLLAQELCEAILEYIYEVPTKLAQLEQRLNQLR